jgi:hypothetical protein
VPAAIHEASRLDLAVLGKLIDNYEYQLKFVVDSVNDLPEIRQTLSQLGNVVPERVMLMPQAATRDDFLAKSPMVADLCKETGFVFCTRLHVCSGTTSGAHSNHILIPTKPKLVRETKVHRIPFETIRLWLYNLVPASLTSMAVVWQ